MKHNVIFVMSTEFETQDTVKCYGDDFYSKVMRVGEDNLLLIYKNGKRKKVSKDNVEKISVDPEYRQKESVKFEHQGKMWHGEISNVIVEGNNITYNIKYAVLLKELFGSWGDSNSSPDDEFITGVKEEDIEGRKNI